MNETRFLQISLIAPLVLPLPFVALSPLVEKAGPVLGVPFVILTGSLFFGGLPYIACVAVGLWLLHGRPAGTWVRASLFAPLMFGAVLALTSFGWAFAESGSVENSAPAGIVFGTYAVLVGYGYVALVHGLRLILLRSGIIGTAV